MYPPLIPDTTGYGKIVVPLDGSPLSEAALPVAMMLARASHATIYLIRVHTPILAGMDVGFPLPDWDDEIREGERAHLVELAKVLSAEGGVQVETWLLDGPVGAALKKAVETLHATLVVLTTHGRTGLSRAWLGSTADWLVRFMSVPVLLVRPPEEPSERPLALSRVLIALDGSDHAERVIAAAIRLGGGNGVRLTLVRVVQPVVRSMATYGTATMPREYDESSTVALMVRAKEYLDRLAVSLRGTSAAVEVSTEAIASDRIAEAILERARTGEADVIALSTRGRGASRLLVGSVADKVVRGFTGTVLALGPASLRELETDEIVEEPEVVSV